MRSYGRSEKPRGRLQRWCPVMGEPWVELLGGERRGTLQRLGFSMDEYGNITDEDVLRSVIDAGGARR